MSTIADNPNFSSARFGAVAEPFLQQEGLPFAGVRVAEDIHQAFAEDDALFASEDIYSTPLVLWAFLARSLRDKKDASCRRAVKDIRTHQVQTGGTAPCDNTGDYCRARAKLSRRVLRKLTRRVAQLVEDGAKEDWLWHGLHAKLWRVTREGIAAHPVGDRPGRIEPRVLKRRRRRHPLMTKPREALRAEERMKVTVHGFFSTIFK